MNPGRECFCSSLLFLFFSVFFPGAIFKILIFRITLKMTNNQDLFKKVTFVKSITRIQDKPDMELPEIAFAGRSNVGKSSLLNAVFNIKRLAKVSSTPGKTQLINYFQAANRAYFVDLPGYGFAKISKAVSKKWQDMIEEYLLRSKNLKFVCLLIDSRHELMKTDEAMVDWLNYQRIPYLVTLTKVDKLSKNKQSQQEKYFASIFPDHHVMLFSIRYKELIQQFKTRIMEMV